VNGHNPEAYDRALKAIRQSQEALIDATPREDTYTLARLGPILAELRAAEEILNAMELPYNA